MRPPRLTCWPVLLFLAVVAFAANAQSVQVTGFFSNMEYFDETGDVVGMEVFILYSSGGYWVLFQDAQGAPAAPVLVKAAITGDALEFTLPASAGLGSFKGQVTASALVGKFSGMQKAIRLPRAKSYWQ